MAKLPAFVICSQTIETIRKWRKRGAEDCQDHSSRPHKLPWKATEEERAIVCALRRSTGFPLDDLTFIVTHFLPHLNRDAVYRILKPKAWAACRRRSSASAGAARSRTMTSASSTSTSSTCPS
jgi:hypothetical protein